LHLAPGRALNSVSSASCEERYDTNIPQLIQNPELIEDIILPRERKKETNNGAKCKEVESTT
jgi:hypothetical protein